MKKPKTKRVAKIVMGAMIIILAIGTLVSAKLFYDWSYKRGYADGTNNQVLCAAAQKDATLTKLCK